MAGVSKQKQKLLLMEQLFEQRTDENHSITGNRLIEILGQMGIKAERKTIYDDVATLCDAGMKIETTKDGHSNAYYLAERLFTDEEIAMLCDLVASSKYLTIKRANEIIGKLQTLTSDYKAPLLKRSIHIENRLKGSGESVYGILDVIHEAISTDCEAEVIYQEKGDRKKPVMKLAVSPYKIVLENDCYYIICYCIGEEINGVCKLRADYMSSLTVGKNKRHALTAQEEELARRLKSPQNS